MLLARIAVEQGLIGPAARDPGEPPRQVDGVENAGVEPERPHRRDQMRRVAHQEHATAPPLGSDAMMDAIDDGVEDFDVVHRADEAQDLLAEFLPRRLGQAAAQRKQEAPAMRLAHQDHPLLSDRRNRRGRDSRAGFGHRGRPSRRPGASARRAISPSTAMPSCSAHGAASAVAGEEIGAFDLAQAVRRLEVATTPLSVAAERGQLVPQMPRPDAVPSARDAGSARDGAAAC